MQKIFKSDWFWAIVITIICLSMCSCRTTAPVSSDKTTIEQTDTSHTTLKVDSTSQLVRDLSETVRTLTERLEQYRASVRERERNDSTVTTRVLDSLGNVISERTDHYLNTVDRRRDTIYLNSQLIDTTRIVSRYESLLLQLRLQCDSLSALSSATDVQHDVIQSKPPLWQRIKEELGAIAITMLCIVALSLLVKWFLGRKT